MNPAAVLAALRAHGRRAARGGGGGRVPAPPAARHRGRADPRRARLLRHGQMGGLVTAFAAAYGATVLVLGRRARRAATAGRSTRSASRCGAWARRSAAPCRASPPSSRRASWSAWDRPARAPRTGRWSRTSCRPSAAPRPWASSRSAPPIGVFLGLVLGGFGIARLRLARHLRASAARSASPSRRSSASLVKEPPRGWSEGRTHEAGERPESRRGARRRSPGSARSGTWRSARSSRAWRCSRARSGASPSSSARTASRTRRRALAAGVIGLLATLGAVAGGVLVRPHVGAERARRAAAPGRLLRRRRSRSRSPPSRCRRSRPPIALLAAARCSRSCTAPPVGAVTQALAPLRMRGMISAVLNSLLTLLRPRRGSARSRAS